MVMKIVFVVLSTLVSQFAFASDTMRLEMRRTNNYVLSSALAFGAVGLAGGCAVQRCSNPIALITMTGVGAVAGAILGPHLKISFFGMNTMSISPSVVLLADF